MGFKQLPEGVQEEVKAQVEYYKSTGQTPNSERRRANQKAIQQNKAQRRHAASPAATAAIPPISVTGTGYVGMKPPKDVKLALEANRSQNNTPSIANRSIPPMHTSIYETESQLPPVFPKTAPGAAGSAFISPAATAVTSPAPDEVPSPPPLPLFSPMLTPPLPPARSSSGGGGSSTLTRKYVDVFSNPDVLDP